MTDISGKIARILSLAPARRGQLSEQYLAGRLKDGTEVRRGPYYVLQWREGGRKRSRRVRAEDVPRVRAELERGREAEALLADVEGELWGALSRAGSKKKPAGSGGSWRR